jgi:hypothetical protein
LETQQERRRKSKRKLKKGKREDQEMTRRVILCKMLLHMGICVSLLRTLPSLSLSLWKTGTEMEINMGRLLPFAHHLTFAVPVKALPSSANLSSTSFLCLWHEAKL